MRQRFDVNKDVKDMRIAKELMAQAEKELFEKQHPQPRRCTFLFFQSSFNCMVLEPY